MKPNKFILDDYITRNFNNKKENFGDFDNLSNNEDTFKRNIRNLLKNFDENFLIDSFQFDENIFYFFPLYQLKTEEIHKFLDHIISLKLSDEFKGNKFISNMKKTNIDNLDLSELYLKPRITSNFQNNIEQIKLEFKILIRTKIRYAQLIIDEFNEIIDELMEVNNPADLESITDLCNFVTLQMVNYWVVTLGGIEEEKRLSLAEKIEQYLLDYQKVIENANITNKNLQLDDTILIFGEFLKTYNFFGELVNITNKLIEEEKENPDFFGEIKLEHKVKKGRSYFEHDYKDIILEGVDNNNFADKFEKTQKAIEIFQNNGVQASDITDLYDLKVYYREIYISNCKYKTKASTIIRKMINANNKKFEKNSEYMFLRQKITRGYFRELYPMELYHYKVKIEELMYKTLLKSMLCYDYHTSLIYLKNLVNEITPLCFQLLDENFLKKGEPTIFM